MAKKPYTIAFSLSFFKVFKKRKYSFIQYVKNQPVHRESTW